MRARCALAPPGRPPLPGRHQAAPDRMRQITPAAGAPAPGRPQGHQGRQRQYPTTSSRPWRPRHPDRRIFACLAVRIPVSDAGTDQPV